MNRTIEAYEDVIRKGITFDQSIYAYCKCVGTSMAELEQDIGEGANALLEASEPAMCALAQYGRKANSQMNSLLSLLNDSYRRSCALAGEDACSFSIPTEITPELRSYIAAGRSLRVKVTQAQVEALDRAERSLKLQFAELNEEFRRFSACFDLNEDELQPEQRDALREMLAVIGSLLADDGIVAKGTRALEQLFENKRSQINDILNLDAAGHVLKLR